MRIAVVGAGISGLAVARLLMQQHDVTLYEQEPRLGGHSTTETVTVPEGTVPVDMGFIVFNRRNYPQLSALFDWLEVPVAESNMSFGVSVENGRVEYSTRTWPALFAQPTNLLRPAFLGMLRDIVRFNRRAPALRHADPDLTLADCLATLDFGEWFQHYYLLAMAGAIWDTAPSHMLQFPAQTIMQFFHNHGLLALRGRPQWYTVRGGSQEYVQRLAEPLAAQTRTDHQVVKVTRQTDGVDIVTKRGTHERYEAVVLACHSDQALRLIDQPTPAETSVLSAIRYWPNRVVLHSDTSFMPRRRMAWASWVYLTETTAGGEPRISLSYWMNNLQPLTTTTPLLVTLNPAREPQADLVHSERLFKHPALDRAAIAAQDQLPSIRGHDRLWFCGAWQRYGFHEDGLASAIAVAEALGCAVPWQ